MAEEKKSTNEQPVTLEMVLEKLSRMEQENTEIRKENAEIKDELEKAQKESKDAKKAAAEASKEKELTEGQKQALMERKIHEAMEEAKKKKVKIMLPIKENGEMDDVFVGVNGEKYLIQRGIEVEVPEFVAAALQDSNDQKMTAILKNRELQDMAAKREKEMG